MWLKLSGPEPLLIDNFIRSHDCGSGGAWSFFVCGLSCQVYSGDERGLHLFVYVMFQLICYYVPCGPIFFYAGEVGGNNRSVMPFDVLGRTRATRLQ